MPDTVGAPNEFSQHAYQCSAHNGCSVIVGFQGDRPVWESHMHMDVPPETRINLDYPEVHDKRHADPKQHKKVSWRLAEKHELEHLGWDDDTHHHVAYHAHRKGLIDDKTAADTVGLKLEEFHGKAEAKRLHVEYDGETPARLKGKK